MSPHSGTTKCRSANLWYTLHNMYLINRVIYNNEISYDTNMIITESTSIDNLWFMMCVLMSTRKRTNRLQYSVCKCEVESTGKWSNVGVLFN
jgi:hypothetical protein